MVFDKKGTLGKLKKGQKYPVGFSGVNVYTEIFRRIKKDNKQKLIYMEEKKLPGQYTANFHYDSSVSEAYLEDIIKTLSDFFGLVSVNQNTYVFGNPKNKTLQYKINFILKEKAGGNITAMQEKGTTVVFNRVLRDRDKGSKFRSAEDILNDPKTKKQLDDVFKKAPTKLVNWVHTYYEQQKQFLKYFESDKWDEFVYEGNDFVTFFQAQIKNVARSLDPLIPVGDYTTWNPSDIWAAYDLPTIQKEIKKNLTPKTQNLVELNSLLVKLFEERKLIGISLKLIGPGRQAHLTFRNDNPKNMTIGKIERYEMRDIKFKLDNIWEKPDKGAATVYADYGQHFGINFTRAGNNISYSSQVKNTSAQGGNAPVGMVIKLMNNYVPGNNYSNTQSDYPASFEDFCNKSDKKFKFEDFKKMYKIVQPHFSGNAPDFEEFAKIGGVLDRSFGDGDAKKARDGRVKLMFLNFFSNAFQIKNPTKQKEFWTDLLYLGMKVGKDFAPHVKIGEKTS